VTHISEQPVVKRGYVRWKWCLQEARSITYLVLKFTSIINTSKTNAPIFSTVTVIESKNMCHDLRRVTSRRFCVFETGNSNFKPPLINFCLCLYTTCTFSLYAVTFLHPHPPRPPPSVCLSLSLSHANKIFENNKYTEISGSMRFLRHQKDNKLRGAEKCLIADDRSASKDVLRLLRKSHFHYRVP